MKGKLHYFFCGLAMGAADVVPGVSGGTIAFITGIYPRLLSAIEAFNLDFFKLVLRFRVREAASLIPWGFLLPLLAGIATSIVSLARAVTYTLATYPIVIWSFFFGLMITSILHLGKDLNRKMPSTWAALAAGAAAGWLLSGASNVDIGQSLPIYFISAFIAICAMILPGISGAFVLVLLGQYTHVIHAVATLNFPVLIVFAAGCACAIMTFARVVGKLLKMWPNAVMAVLTGLMTGSLRTIWPWKSEGVLALPPALDSRLFVALVCALVGMALPFLLSMAAKRK
jgi:putative membrane protein